MTTNWRNPAEYPDPKTTKPARWAWEFLRRDPNYRKDWEKYAPLPVDRRDAMASKYGISRMADPESCNTDLEALLLGWKICEITAYDNFVRVGTGLAISHVGPEEPIPGIGEAQHKTSTKPCSEIRLHELRMAAENVYVRFNLAWPIEAQWRDARSVLRMLQADFKCRYPELMVSNKRNRGEYFRAYLRLLDAEAAGASIDEMTALLPKDLSEKGSELQKAVKYSLDRAKWFRDGGYRYLLLIPHKEK